MTTLKDKTKLMNYYDKNQESKFDDAILYNDVKEAILDYKIYQSIYYWRAKNIGQKDTKEIIDKINHLEKTYNCKYYELGFNEIFGNFEK